MKTDKLKKVLIALDYNTTAQKVAEEGYTLAKAMGAEVILLHVMSEPVYYSSLEYSPIMGFTDYMGVTPLQFDSFEGLNNAAQHFLDKTMKHLGDENIITLIKEGDFDEAIIKAAKEVHANVIVMGSHSRRWLEDILIGSVTEKVLNKTTIPLFIIPTKKHN